MFAGSTIEVAEETQVKIGALGTPDVSIPDGSAAEVAGRNNIGLDWNERDWSHRLAVYGLVMYHLTEEVREQW